MSKNILVIFIVAIICASCSDPTNKNLFEELTLKELQTSINQDSSFIKTYEYISGIKDTVLTDKVSRSKYADLTYKRVHQQVKYRKKIGEMHDEFVADWETTYSGIEKEVDSLSTFWKEHEQENGLYKYVYVNFTDKLDDSWNTYLGFRYTPLVEEIEEITFTYQFERKFDYKGYKSVRYKMQHNDKRYTHTDSKPFSTPITRYVEADVILGARLSGTSVFFMERDFYINITINEVKTNNQVIKDEVPTIIRDAWEYGLVEDIVKEAAEKLLDEEYVRKSDYITEQYNSRLKKKDSLVFDFLKEY